MWNRMYPYLGSAQEAKARLQLHRERRDLAARQHAHDALATEAEAARADDVRCSARVAQAWRTAALAAAGAGARAGRGQPQLPAMPPAAAAAGAAGTGPGPGPGAGAAWPGAGACAAMASHLRALLAAAPAPQPVPARLDARFRGVRALLEEFRQRVPPGVAARVLGLGVELVTIQARLPVPIFHYSSTINIFQHQSPMCGAFRVVLVARPGQARPGQARPGQARPGQARPG